MLFYRYADMKDFAEMPKARDVTYCISLGDLPDKTAEAIAQEHEYVFYCDPTRKVYFLRGYFDGSLHPNIEYDGQILVICPSDVLDDKMQGVCARAIYDFNSEMDYHVPECSDGWFEIMCRIKRSVDIIVNKRRKHSSGDQVDGTLAGIAERSQLQAGEQTEAPKTAVSELVSETATKVCHQATAKQKNSKNRGMSPTTQEKYKMLYEEACTNPRATWKEIGIKVGNTLGVKIKESAAQTGATRYYNEKLKENSNFPQIPNRIK